MRRDAESQAKYKKYRDPLRPHAQRHQVAGNAGIVPLFLQIGSKAFRNDRESKQPLRTTARSRSHNALIRDVSLNRRSGKLIHETDRHNRRAPCP
jgi:hypothetical protein